LPAARMSAIRCRFTMIRGAATDAAMPPQNDYGGDPERRRGPGAQEKW
jgi:hypothetical protein